MLRAHYLFHLSSNSTNKIISSAKWIIYFLAMHNPSYRTIHNTSNCLTCKSSAAYSAFAEIEPEPNWWLDNYVSMIFVHIDAI